ncbi:MAG: alternative ribosome rescue aminoacyl-tRNA hydrolase ArfB [Spirochaetales bacterium]|nr:alternative ribosome rescue aminoacyl-tRNA hydrolase ArfB [Spirochaetales bacterium]
MLIISNRIQIPLSQVKIRMIKASGPGGQHVNTSSTAVQLTFDVGECAQLMPQVRQRLRQIAGSRMSKNGVISIDCREYRSLERNKQAGLSRMADLIRQALVVPKKRKATKPTRGSQKRRLETKKKRSQTKASRGKTQW